MSTAGNGRVTKAASARTDAVVPLLMITLVGAVVAVALGAYGRVHGPTGVPIATFGFASLLDMKAWTTTAAVILGVLQVVTAAGMWGRLPRVAGTPAWLGSAHRWSGTAAFVLILPVAYHCLWSLGFQILTLRAAIHSVLGCAFFGLFAAKMLALRLRGLPGIALPLLGGTLFAALAALWATSSLWFFTAVA